jgi:hypothetical protein
VALSALPMVLGKVHPTEPTVSERGKRAHLRASGIQQTVSLDGR